MNFRQFGNTELRVSEVGFGAWAIGGAAMIGDTAIGWGRTDDSVSLDAIHAALDAGINFFDTADIYGLGHSETLLGKALKGKKDIIIATKVGNVSRNELFTVDYSADHILRACEASLKRLKRNEIDYYQLHTARMAHLEEGSCIAAMQDLKKQGKIRYWGLSLNSFDPEPEAQFLLQNDLGNGFQLVLNILNQKALPILHNANEKGFGIIARMPLQFGLLTGKFDQGIEFENSDHRKKRVTPALVSEVNETLAPVWKLCARYQCSKTELALSFVLSHPEISVVIPGIRTRKQVIENTSGLFQLETGDRLMMQQLWNEEGVKLFEQIKALG